MLEDVHDTTFTTWRWYKKNSSTDVNASKRSRHEFHDITITTRCLLFKVIYFLKHISTKVNISRRSRHEFHDITITTRCLLFKVIYFFKTHLHQSEYFKTFTTRVSRHHDNDTMFTFQSDWFFFKTHLHQSEYFKTFTTRVSRHHDNDTMFT